jgi:hypothetical protein
MSNGGSVGAGDAVGLGVADVDSVGDVVGDGDVDGDTVGMDEDDAEIDGGDDVGSELATVALGG